MSTVFVLLLFLAVIGFIWGMVAPRHLAKTVRVTRPVTRRHMGLFFGTLLIGLFILIGITAPPTPAKTQTVDLNVAGTSSSHSTVSTPKVTKKQTTETKTIAYTTTTQNDAALAKGQTNILQAGKEGVETLTYSVAYTNGAQTSKTLLSDVVTTQPVTQIVAVGTYVAPTVTPPAPKTTTPTNCTNGTYVNTAGNTVCSPEAAPSVPAGATAQCVDGTYSFSQTHSGTCSHHGGVARWL